MQGWLDQDTLDRLDWDLFEEHVQIGMDAYDYDRFHVDMVRRPCSD